MASPELSSRSPRLPWEVIERIISHASHPKTIPNFSLTCRELRPRSLCLLVVHVTLHSRNKVFDFCDFLKANPHLKPLVRSISIIPDDFAPVPLLHMLPSLSQIRFTVLPLYPSGDALIRAVFNQSTLTGCQFLSANTQSLSLSNLFFKTPIQFLRVLSAFSSIKHLACSRIHFDTESELAPLDVAKRRLAPKLHLRTLAITSPARILLDEYSSMGKLLLDSGLVQSTIESLTVEGVYRKTGLPQQFNWPRLQSLAVKLWFSSPGGITNGIVFLKDFHHLTLKEVSVEVHEPVVLPATQDHASHADLFAELERTLLRFSRARLVWVLDVFPISRNSSRVQEVENLFPVLLQRGALTVVPSNTEFRTGHVQTIRTLIVSPDGKWVASASEDGTIALWDTANGAMVQRWIADNLNNSIISLAFSPNGRFLVSTTWDCSRLFIRDLRHGDLHQVLEDNTDNASTTQCAWSSVGDVIACGFQDATVRLWDANTFQPLHVLKHWPESSKITFLKFSPDGRWLLIGYHTGPAASYYDLWDVVLGTGRQLSNLNLSLDLEAHDIHTILSGTFNPTSTRLAIPSAIGIVEILEISGERGDVILERGTGEPGWKTKHLAFSPDGNLVLVVPVRWHSSSHTVKIWDAYTGIKLLSLEGHKKPIWTACFSPCGKYIASASDDHTVRLWRTSDGSCVATLSDHESRVTEVVFSPDGKTLISGGYNGSVIMRQMCDVLPIDEQDP